MRRMSGFTLIEVMVVMAIVAILTVIAFPSYQAYIQRGIRAQGQQFLMDLAQRQEQYFLDNRSYAPGYANGTVPLAGQIAIPMPPQVAANYTLTPALCVAPCTTFIMALTVNGGSPMATVNACGGTRTDGDLYINNLQQRWREVDGNATYSPKAGGGCASGDCLWEDGHCTPMP